MTNIHPTAIVDKTAELASDVLVGAYAIIGANVIIGEGCEIMHHANVQGPMTIGKRNTIHPFASIGCIPLDKLYKGENTTVIMGDDNIVREYATINRGTLKEAGKTIIGDGNLIMSYVHIAHDCVVGNNNILTNQVALSGHVKIGNNNSIGGNTGMVQFCRLGDHTFIPGLVKIGMNVPSYLVLNTNGKPSCINKIGLRRNNFKQSNIRNLTNAFKILYKKNLLLKEAKVEIAKLATEDEKVKLFLDSIELMGNKILR